jgi:hypothetical protein
MYVVPHHDPGEEIVEAPLVGSDQDGMPDWVGYALVFEPQWTGSEAVEAVISRRKGLAGSQMRRGFFSCAR